MICAYLFALIVGLKFALNLFRLLGVYFCYYKFKKGSPHLAQYIELVDRLFTAAGSNQFVFEDSLESDNCNRISFFLEDKSCRKNLERAFQQTIGAYKLRMFECINPFYWIFLPKYLLQSLDLKPSKLAVSIWTVAYWFLSAIATIILETVVAERYGNLLQQIVDMLP